MTIKEITVSADRKVQVKQFEPMTVYYSAMASVTQNEDIDAAYKELTGVVKKQLDDSVRKMEGAKYGVSEKMQDFNKDLEEDVFVAESPHDTKKDDKALQYMRQIPLPTTEKRSNKREL